MNERQIELYKLLMNGERKRSDITITLNNYYHRIEEIEHGVKDENSTAFRMLRQDISDINKSNSQHKIVTMMSGNKLRGYKLAENTEELTSKADRYHAEAMRLLELEKAIRTAVRNDGQFRIAGEEDIKEINAYGRAKDVR